MLSDLTNKKNVISIKNNRNILNESVSKIKTKKKRTKKNDQRPDTVQSNYEEWVNRIRSQHTNQEQKNDIY